MSQKIEAAKSAVAAFRAAMNAAPLAMHSNVAERMALQAARSAWNDATDADWPGDVGGSVDFLRDHYRWW